MKRVLLFLLGTSVLGGCATFKELEPDPELLPTERGYIELKEDEDDFELDKGGKYFIRFPGPERDRLYLVLVTQAKKALRTSLTNTFDDGKGPMTPIPDEASSSDSIMVYAIARPALTYYWVIDSVAYDLKLALRYRYVPQWRYTFENRYEEFKEVLAANTVDRSTYNSIDVNFPLERLDLGRDIAHVEERTARIEPMKDELLRLESVFPPDIAASRDTAYEQYVALKSKVDDELAFQENYAMVLNLFRKEKDTRGNTAMFLDAVPYFSSIVSQRGRFPAGVVAKASQVLSGRLSEVAPYLDRLLREKDDINRISPGPPVEVVAALYRACGQEMPRETESVLRFVNRFNVEVEGLQAGNARFNALNADFNSHRGPAPQSFYASLAVRAGEIRAAIPEAQTRWLGQYGSYRCALMLTRELQNAAQRAGDLQTMYESSAIIAGHIGNGMWGSAEKRLRELHETQGASYSPDVSTQRKAVVGRFENEIFGAVKTASEQRINAFIKAHEMAIDNVAGLYADSAFRPVHQLTFSSAGPGDLARKRDQVQGYLDQIKYVQFPESSIKSIYSEFTRNMRDRGVEKARAIVEHGKFYKGSDDQVKGLITECDVQAAKWIIRPKEYRKLFALPVTDNKQGVNEYMFRIRLQIPSEAQFPVFDVNVKLPQEIAEQAGQQQWYESITIDKKPIKNEGRFRITSPTAENNYETLITPVQMDKAGRNILEVRFKYPGFRVFEVSTMAQVPIIRKN